MPTTIQQQVARALLEIEAVVFTPDAPITFKSGIRSPVYVDNRRLIFWPAQWKLVIEGFVALIAEKSLDYDVIAGIAAAGVPHSSALAYTLAQPSIFIRKEAKGHGTQSRIEGGNVSGKRVLLVEDLVTTGGSSLAGVDALKEEGATATDLLCVTSYGFAEAADAFAAAGVGLHPLTPFSTIADEALALNYFDATARAQIDAWMADPHHWSK